LTADESVTYARGVPDVDSECWVFISHIHEDQAAAVWLAEQIRTDFLGKVSVYVAPEAPAGVNWFSFLSDHIHKSMLVVVICSEVSVTRAWVHFEVGAAWILGRPIIPACYDGMTPDSLPRPLNDFNGVTLTEAEGLSRLYRQVAELAGMGTGRWPFDDYVTQVPSPQPVGGPADKAAASQLDPDGNIRRLLHESLRRSYAWRTIRQLTIQAGLDDEEVVRTILRADDEVRFGLSKKNAPMAGLKSRVGP
jgi:hypothetical protein